MWIEPHRIGGNLILLWESTNADQKRLNIVFSIANFRFKLPICNLKCCFNTYQSALLNSRDSSRLPPILCVNKMNHLSKFLWTRNPKTLDPPLTSHQAFVFVSISEVVIRIRRYPELLMQWSTDSLSLTVRNVVYNYYESTNGNAGCDKMIWNQEFPVQPTMGDEDRENDNCPCKRQRLRQGSIIWAISWENLSSEVCDPVRLKLAC